MEVEFMGAVNRSLVYCWVIAQNDTRHPSRIYYSYTVLLFAVPLSTTTLLPRAMRYFLGPWPSTKSRQTTSPAFAGVERRALN